MPDYDTVTEVAEGIYQVQLPLPYALRIVNCYLLHGKAGWTIVDTGINIPEGQAQWRAAFNELELNPTQIEQIVLTHMHPDHFGLAGWLQSLTSEHDSPPVYLPAREERQIVMFTGSDDTIPFFRFLWQGGMPEEMAQAVAQGLNHTREITKPYPDRFQYFHAGEHIRMGDRSFQIIHTPGHSDGHVMFYDTEDQLLLSGDHVLMKITPNIGLWTTTEPDPLGRFMSSLEELKMLEVRLALPGHKWLIQDWQGRIEELLEHHEARLVHTLEAIEDGATTVYEIAGKVFEIERFSLHEWRFAIAETLAHLELLCKHEKATRNGADIWQYRLT